MEPLVALTKLKYLNSKHNQITSLQPLSTCSSLVILNCEQNVISSLDPLINLQRLDLLYYLQNPIEIKSNGVQKMLNRLAKNNENDSDDE